MKKLIKITCLINLIALGIFVSLLVLEISLRLTHYQKNELPWQWTETAKENGPNLYAPHYQRIYAFNKNVSNREDNYHPYCATDKYGLRYDPSHKDNNSFEKSIAMIGDSFTYGYSMKIDNSYPFLLEKLLKNANKNIIVYNAGVPGYGPDQEFIYIRDEIIPTFHPKIIVWNINFNDVRDSNRKCLFKEKNGSFKEILAVRNTLFLQGIIIRNTPFFLQSSSLLNIILNLPMTVTQSRDYTFGCTLPSDTPYQKEFDQFSKKMRFFFTELEKIKQKENLKVILVLAPIQFYFDEEYKRANQADFLEYENLKNLLSSSGFQFIDSSQAISELFYSDLAPSSQSQVLGYSSEKLTQTLFLEDGFKYGTRHLNELGNQIFAQVVASKLINKK